MRTAAVLLALCGVAALAGRADDPDPEPPGGAKAELRKLKGTWTVTKTVWQGREVKARPGLTYTFDGDKLTKAVPALAAGKIKAKALKQTYKVKIDAKKEPHAIELIPDGGGAGQAGVYKIEKGQLHLATGRPGRGAKGAVAPKDFSGDAGPVFVMTREKAKEKAKE